MNRRNGKQPRKRRDERKRKKKQRERKRVVSWSFAKYAA